MHVFVTGATGALGRATVPRLHAAGHRVSALAYSSEQERRISKLGATPVTADLFDRPTLFAALDHVDAVLHLATRIPGRRDIKRRSAWADNDRLRANGTRNLVHAALRAGVTTVVYPGIVFPYADAGDAWIDEDAPLACPELLRSTLVAEQEVQRFTATGVGRCGVVLRMAALYGRHSASTTDLLRFARRGINPYPGPPQAYGSAVWDEDAAAALVAALHAPAGIYNIVDDEPLTRVQTADALATALRRRHVRTLPVAAARFAVGRRMEFLLRSHRVSNSRFKQLTGWKPAVPSLREGLTRLTGEASARRTQVRSAPGGGATRLNAEETQRS